MSSSTRPPSPAQRNFAPERRQDLITGQWIVVAGERHGRPQDVSASPPSELPLATSCAFCAGREHETTPTVASYPAAAGQSGTWQVRVVSNLYPAFVPSVAATGHCDGDTVVGGPCEPSRGLHEVVIESATHRRRLTELTHSEVELVFHAYRDRLSTIRRQGHYRYALIFKNSGHDAGMTREHLHSQLVALPEVPPLVRLELLGSVRFFRTHRRCAFCQLVDETTRDQRRVVLETETVLAFCPYASRVAYEVWVLPKRHEACFEQTDDRTLNAVARGVRDVVERLETRLGPLAYNFVLHSNPFDTTCQDHYHWHIEILPRTSRLAGLEWGTGLLVNTIQPEVAAEQLRELAKL